jgi:hypothetical protein
MLQLVLLCGHVIFLYIRVSNSILKKKTKDLDMKCWINIHKNIGT